jgi:hypothetical protein
MIYNIVTSNSILFDQMSKIRTAFTAILQQKCNYNISQYGEEEKRHFTMYRWQRLMYQAIRQTVYS